MPIDGFLIGTAENQEAGTGVTAIICPDGATAGVDVRGGGPATRETDLLRPENMVQAIHSVTLSGGSAFGLTAASGVMAVLEEKHIGFETGYGKVPIVCGASLFDLPVGDGKIRPDIAMGRAAAENAFKNQKLLSGNVGAGTGATVGKYRGPARMMKSGQGVSTAAFGDLQIGAVVAVNALGDVFDGETKIAGLLDESGAHFGKTTYEEMLEDVKRDHPIFPGNTTIACVMTNAKLTKAQCLKIASIAHDGYARAISPVHTSGDGDTIFVMASGKTEGDFDAIAAVAAEQIRLAILDGVRSAAPLFGLKTAGELN